MARTSVTALAIALTVACSGASTQAPTPKPSGTHDGALVPADAAEARPAVTVGVALTVTPLDADVLIDERPQGKASAIPSPLALDPGLHTLVVTRDGFKPYRAEFSVTDKIEAFVVKLDRGR